ncbi:hypothetical protein ACQKP8_16130 [Photobacterium alginatilyticum]
MSFEISRNKNQMTENAKDRKRGFWLTSLLVLMLVINPLTAFSYFSNPDLILTVFPNASLGLVYLLGGMCIFNIFLAIGIWMWKKLAIYGFYAVIVFALLTNLYLGVGAIGTLSGLIGGVLLFLTTKNKMDYFT